MIQLSLESNLGAKRRRSQELKAIFQSVFKMFRERVASLISISN